MKPANPADVALLRTLYKQLLASLDVAREGFETGDLRKVRVALRQDESTLRLIKTVLRRLDPAGAEALDPLYGGKGDAR